MGEIHPRHFEALAQSLPDPNLWPTMLGMAGSVPDVIAAVRKRLPADFKESVWTGMTKGLAKKAREFLSVGEKLED